MMGVVMAQLEWMTLFHGIAQAPVIVEPDVVPPETASVLFSGPQFLIALISGLLMAFAFQLVLTNLSVAAGISYLGRFSDPDHHSDHSSDDDHSGLSVRKISVGMGLWTLITVTLALFVACFFAVQLSLLTSARLGAIVGLVIWAGYFSLLMWVGSSTVGSLIGSVVNTATSGLQSIIGTATAMVGARTAQRQVVSTAEAVVSAVRNELGTAVDPVSIRESVEDYIQRLPLPRLDFNRVQRDLESLLNDPELQELADHDHLRHIDRQTFVDLVSRRTDFTPDEINRFADLLEGAWRQTLGRRRNRDQMSELVDYLRSTQPGELRTRELNAKLDRVLAERRYSQGQTGGSHQGGGLQSTLQSGITTIVGMLAGRTDLSDLDLEQILRRLQETPAKVAEQRDKVVGQLQGDRTAESYSPIRTDLENYLMHVPLWQMSPERVAREVREILYDPEGDPEAIAQQLSRLDRPFFVNILTSRGLFTQDRIQTIADTLETVRLEAIVAARAAKEREVALDLRERVGVYLTLTPKEQMIQPENNILPDFKALLEDNDADYETLHYRLMPYDRESLRQIMWQRQDITPAELESILDALDVTRDRVLFESQALDEQAKQKLTDARQKLENYLRSTGKAELNPEAIERDLQLLLSDPQLGWSALRNRASQFDRDTLVQILSQREDMTEADAQRIIADVESRWHTLVHSPRIVTDMAKHQYDQTVHAIADYLRRTNLQELDPDGIQRDLTTLLEDPKEGTLALRRRLSQVDRETLVRLLSQRQDLSEEQVNQAIDQVQQAIQRIIRAPRRLALRAQQQVMSLEASLEDYLRNTEKEELNPEGIKRDLQMLLTSPQYGLQQLSDRLSQFDRNTVVALLAQRQDMTPEEAERVVVQIESVRNQVLDQMHQIQHRIQRIIDRMFDRIRNYMNSLDRPELNYEGVKHDLRTLFDDPQAGFEALRQRLSQFDRGTLVALISSRRDISEADANRIIDQIESARNSVLQRAERIQMEAQRRLEQVKLEAQHQVEETRKAAAAAAWWLFVTAIVSAVASAGAGAIASV